MTYEENVDIYSGTLIRTSLLLSQQVFQRLNLCVKVKRCLKQCSTIYPQTDVLESKRDTLEDGEVKGSLNDLLQRLLMLYSGEPLRITGHFKS